MQPDKPHVILLKKSWVLVPVPLRVHQLSHIAVSMYAIKAERLDSFEFGESASPSELLHLFTALSLTTFTTLLLCIHDYTKCYLTPWVQRVEGGALF